MTMNDDKRMVVIAYSVGLIALFLIKGNSYHDNYWGSYSCKKCAGKPKLNWLGKILMDVRDKLRKK